MGDEPWSVAFSPNGSVAYVANESPNNVSVIDVGTENVTNTINVGDDPNSVAFSPDGLVAYVANGNSANVSVIDVDTENVTNTINVGRNPWSVAFSPDGSVDQPPRAVPPTVLVRPPPGAWGEGLGASGDRGKPAQAGSPPGPAADRPESCGVGWCCTPAATAR